MLEIPTTLWTRYDAALFGIAPADNVLATVRDRAMRTVVLDATLVPKVDGDDRHRFFEPFVSVSVGWCSLVSI